MPVPSKVIFTQGNTQDIKLIGLQDKDTLLFLNAAVASGSLVDQLGNPTEIYGVPLIYQPGSLGVYVGTFTTDFAMPVGSGYTLLIDATQGGAKFHLELPAEVQIRSS